MFIWRSLFSGLHLLRFGNEQVLKTTGKGRCIVRYGVFTGRGMNGKKEKGKMNE